MSSHSHFYDSLPLNLWVENHSHTRNIEHTFTRISHFGGIGHFFIFKLNFISISILNSITIISSNWIYVIITLTPNNFALRKKCHRVKTIEALKILSGAPYGVGYNSSGVDSVIQPLVPSSSYRS